MSRCIEHADKKKREDQSRGKVMAAMTEKWAEPIYAVAA